jgi:hypothetical protein
MIAMCAAALAAAPAGGNLSGVWGGDRAIFSVGAQGASLRTDCAAGELNMPMIRHPAGRYTATGTFQPFTPGPQRADEEAAPPPPSVTYEARVTGETMTLTLAGRDLPAPLTFRLQRGVHPRLVRCY